MMRCLRVGWQSSEGAISEADIVAFVKSKASPESLASLIGALSSGSTPFFPFFLAAPQLLHEVSHWS